MTEIHVTLLGRFAVTVGGVPVAEACWKRRHAAAVVKVLALAPERRLHREQVIDLVWPGDTMAEAVPKLHKAAHFARRAIGVPDSVMLRGDQVVLCPGGSVTLRDRLLAAHEVFPHRDSPLIGRDLEISIAERALLDAAAGANRTLIISGEAGAGKSSLLAAIATRARERGFLAGHGTAALVEGAWPYAPVIEALGGVCRQDPGLLSGLAGPHRDELDRVRNGTPAPWAGQSTHQRLFVAAAELVKLAAAGKGLLLTVDDVHDADDGSLRLLHYLARSARGHRVCIVLAHRPVPAAHALEATRRGLIDRYDAAELRLGPLADHDAAALVRRSVAEPSAELVRLVTTLGRGVPFLVAELARRAVPTAGAGPNSTDGPDWAPALRASMFAPLRPATRAVLQRVAVAGSSFDTDEFVALSGLAEAEAFDHLDDALAARIIEPASAGYRFRHCLIRDALTGDVPAHRRRRLHHDTARRLVELGASPVRIGHHFLAADAGADAVPQPTAIPARRGPGCSGPPGGSSRSASRWTPPGADGR
jgi:AAA ATPase-like protein